MPRPAIDRRALDAICEAIGAGAAVCLHRRGGAGRTGTVAGCLLREQGSSAPEAFAVLARRWLARQKRSLHPVSPEPPGQIALIERRGGG